MLTAESAAGCGAGKCHRLLLCAVGAPPGTGFPYRDWPCIDGTVKAAGGEIPRVSSLLTWADIFGRWQMRWGLGRHRYRIRPGLYAVGNPTPASPVLVTANYKMTFDLLRRELVGLDAWLLVLDTRGINVWCAAGKGTFGTAEVIRQVRAARLEQVVSHRVLVLPQLAAPGVAAHRVRQECGFRVVYGPVRAGDIRSFLAAGMQASPSMRRVTFSAGERLILTPVELTGMRGITLWTCRRSCCWAAWARASSPCPPPPERGGAAVLAYLAGLLAGCVLTPLLLPWLPGRAFAAKGAFAGGVSALAAAIALGLPVATGGAMVLAVSAVASYAGMNFTGSTPFTSPSGVEKEMRRAHPTAGGSAADCRRHVDRLCFLIITHSSRLLDASYGKVPLSGRSNQPAAGYREMHRLRPVCAGLSTRSICAGGGESRSGRPGRLHGMRRLRP